MDRKILKFAVTSLFLSVSTVVASNSNPLHNCNDNRINNAYCSVANPEGLARPARILALDGGGVKGIILTKILENIENKTGKRIHELFDVIAGTSAGGIVALGLNVRDPRENNKPKYSARDLSNIFLENGDTIFPNSTWRRIRTLGGLFGAKHSNAGIIEVTRKYFGDSLISNSLTNVLVTAFDAKANLMKLFNNVDATESKDEEFFMRDVALATSAAPVYLPAATIKNARGDEFTFIDGGVGANNPTAQAISYARNLGLDVHNAIIVSIGTGSRVKVSSDEEFVHAGLVGWGPKIIDTMFTASSSATHNAIANAYMSADNGNYYRIQTMLSPEDTEMDDASPEHMNRLVTSANQTINNQNMIIEKICKELLNKLSFINKQQQKKQKTAPMATSSNSTGHEQTQKRNVTA